MYRFATLFSTLAVFSAVTAADITLKPEDVRILKVTISTPEPTGLESLPKKDEKPADKQKQLVDALFATEGVKGIVEAAEKPLADAVKKAKEDSKFHFSNIVEVNEKDCRGAEKSKSCAFKATRRYGWYADPFLLEEVTGYVLLSKTK